MATNVPLNKPKLTELTVHLTGLRVIRDARIMQVADEFVRVRFRKNPKSMKLQEQIFPWSAILYMHDRCPGDDKVDEGTNGIKHAKRVCTIIVRDQYDMDELANDIESFTLQPNGMLRCVVQGADNKELVFINSTIARLQRSASWGPSPPGAVAREDDSSGPDSITDPVVRPRTVSPAFD